MKYCMICGKELKDEVMFCPNCGTKSVSTEGEKVPTEPMYSITSQENTVAHTEKLTQNTVVQGESAPNACDYWENPMHQAEYLPQNQWQIKQTSQPVYQPQDLWRTNTSEPKTQAKKKMKKKNRTNGAMNTFLVVHTGLLLACIITLCVLFVQWAAGIEEKIDCLLEGNAYVTTQENAENKYNITLPIEWRYG